MSCVSRNVSMPSANEDTMHGVYTSGMRLFRGGEEYMQHVIHRLVLGIEGYCFALISRPRDRVQVEVDDLWEPTNISGKWSVLQKHAAMRDTVTSFSNSFSSGSLSRASSAATTRTSGKPLLRAVSLTSAAVSSVTVRIHDNCGTYFMISRSASCSDLTNADVNALEMISKWNYPVNRLSPSLRVPVSSPENKSSGFMYGTWK
jgi:hypothetical protein